jgi:hypothetical protein
LVDFFLFKDWGFLRKIQKMHPQNGWIKKLLVIIHVPSESDNFCVVTPVNSPPLQCKQMINFFSWSYYTGRDYEFS